MYNEYVHNCDLREAIQARRRNIETSRFHLTEVKKVSDTHTPSLSTGRSKNS
jgi:hypothetical protein